MKKMMNRNEYNGLGCDRYVGIRASAVDAAFFLCSPSGARLAASLDAAVNSLFTTARECIRKWRESCRDATSFL